LAIFSQNRKKIKLHHKFEVFQKKNPNFFVKKTIGVVPKKYWPKTLTQPTILPPRKG
jgi:hypothetical protein